MTKEKIAETTKGRFSFYIAEIMNGLKVKR